MDLREFVALVKEMRAAQDVFFRTRAPGTVCKARELERAVDKVVAKLTDTRPKLFD
jgi:hypothetical protein